LSNIGNKSPSNNSNNNSVAVKIVPFGPSIKNINSLTSKLINRPKVRTYLKSISQDEGGERLQQNKTMTANKQTPSYYPLNCSQKQLLPLLQVTVLLCQSPTYPNTMITRTITALL
jgi:hemolysin-activating ACP:hemolysin acyltransferase